MRNNDYLQLKKKACTVCSGGLVICLMIMVVLFIAAINIEKWSTRDIGLTIAVCCLVMIIMSPLIIYSNRIYRKISLVMNQRYLKNKYNDIPKRKNIDVWFYDGIHARAVIRKDGEKLSLQYEIFNMDTIAWNAVFKGEYSSLEEIRVIMEDEFEWELPIPDYLLEIFQPDLWEAPVERLRGKLKCDCGCECFSLRYYADISETRTFLYEKEFEDTYALKVNGVCNSCKKEWELFDNSKHGYDGFVCCEEKLMIEKELLHSYICPKCNADSFYADIEIMLEDYQQFLEEVVKDSNGKYVDEDYRNAFNSINISLKCQTCRAGYKDWCMIETS